MNLVERAKNIIVTPKTEWPVIASETPDTQQIMVTYVMPLVVLVAIANIIGWVSLVPFTLHLSGELRWGLCSSSQLLSQSS